MDTNARNIPWLALAVVSLVLGGASLAAASDELTGSPVPRISSAAGEARTRSADFRSEVASSDARRVANWVAESGDAGAHEFVIVDKRSAKLYVFDKEATLLGATTILLGGAKGDDSVLGIGSRPLAQVRPEERTTPAGRFVAERGHNALGEDIVWVYYDAAVSMHRVRTNNRAERRLERLASNNIDDKRISFGCINVPAAFYERLIRPMFRLHRSVVYVLPEVKTIDQVFGLSGAASALPVSN